MWQCNKAIQKCMWTAHITQPLKTFVVLKLYGATQSPSTIKRERRGLQQSCVIRTDTTESMDRWIVTQRQHHANRQGGRQADRQCTREGVGTGSLGLVTTLALLLIWRDRVDRQVDRRDRAEVTRLSVQTIALQIAAVEGKVEHCAQVLLSRMAGVSESIHHCASNMCDLSSSK